MHICPNKKVYIGITSCKPTRRWANGSGYPNNPYFTNAILKYGWDNIEHKILFENLEEKVAKDIEIKLISIWKSQDMCYNITDGGDGYKGIKHDKDFCDRLSKRSVGNTWGSLKTKPILQIDKDTNQIIAEYDSAREANKITGISYKGISRAIKKGFICKGYKWKYKYSDGQYVCKRRE